MKTMLLILMALVPQDERAIKDKQAEVMAFAKTAKNERDFRAATSDLAKLAEQAFGINKYELAAKLYADAEKIAQASLKDAALAQSFQAAGKKTLEVGKEYSKASKAMTKILTNEATPEDFTASGRFLCFVKGDWELGLNDLSKGKDETLKKLAEDDIAAGNPVALADAWFTLLKKEPASKERALFWYAKAWPTLTGVSREKVRERAKLLQRVSTGKHGPVPSGWRISSEKSDGQWLDPEFAHSGKYSVGHLSGLQGPGRGVAWDEQQISARPGAKLKVRAWFLTDGTDGNDILFLISYDADARPIGEARLSAPADSPFWTRIEKEAVVPANAARVVVSFQPLGKQGMIWLDDVSVQDENGAELVKNGGFEDK